MSEQGDTHRLTRRRLIGAGAAAAGAAALSRVPGAEARRHRKHHRKHKKHKHKRVDVVVVGGGFAGLTAALRLVQNGNSVRLIEARDRVGGRVLNHPISGGEISEAGGTFTGPTQDRIQALAREFGVGTFPTFDTGDNVYVRDGNRTTYSDTGPTGTAPLDPVILADLTLAITALDSMSGQVPVGAPWTSPNSAQWDAQTLASWLAANTLTSQFRDEVVPAATRAIFGAEPRELSLLYTLFYIASSGNEQNPGTFERNFSTRGGAQEQRFFGGSQKIALDVAAVLGRRVILGSPVRRIVQDGRGVTVFSDKATVRGKQAIVAMPPTLAGRIDYEPTLPFDRDQLTQRLPQGTMTKVAAVYDRPFWRDAGLNGTAVSTDGFVNVTFDDSPPSGSKGIVFGFVGGDRARAFNGLSDSSRRAAVLAQYVQFFGAAAGSPIDYLETNWSAEQWTRGCPVGIAPPGVLTAYGHALRKPVGRIHWAGTETSNYWNGYMDGAVRSGERAAAEAAAAV